MGFRTLMLDRMSATLPTWTERNPADLGVTLVEVLADAADKASWFQDAVATEAFFDRTRFRQSLVRHARLLGYRPGEGTNARTAVACTAGQDRNGAPAVIPRGTRVLTGPDLPGAVHPAVIAPDVTVFEDLLRRGSIVFEALEPLVNLRQAQNEIRLHDWGDGDCCLMPGATSAFLVGAPGDLDLRTGDLLILEERIPFGGTAGDPPDLAHRQLVRLSKAPIAARDPVFALDLTEIFWFAEDALTFPLPLGEVGGLPRAVARGNVFLVDEGRSIDHAAPRPEDAIAVETVPLGGLAPDDGPGQALRFRLAGGPIVRSVPFDPATARAAAAFAALNPIGEPVARMWWWSPAPPRTLPMFASATVFWVDCLPTRRSSRPGYGWAAGWAAMSAPGQLPMWCWRTVTASPCSQTRCPRPGGGTPSRASPSRWLPPGPFASHAGQSPSATMPRPSPATPPSPAPSGAGAGPVAGTR
jgi:hypothetical protein